MQGMEKISEAILDKVKADAQQIIKEAEEKAGQEVERAENQKAVRLEEEKRKAIEEAEQEATRILAQASVKERQELSRVKAELIDTIVSRVKKMLSGTSSDGGSSLNLIKEAINALDVDKARVYVSHKDINTVPGLIKGEEGLASRVVEIKEIDCTGGVIAESIDGKIRIDNTYDARLEMLLPQILPEISKELFEGL